MSAGPRSTRTTVRLQDRARYDRGVINEILDEAYFAHVGFVTDSTPFVVPMLHARIDDSLYLHGSPASRIMRTIKRGGEICVTVSILDGLVLARSAFHHSANYRSAMVIGTPTVVEALSRRRDILDAYTDKLVPDRRSHLRPMTDKEVRGTVVLELSLEESSAKVREGGPIDEPGDMDLDVWAGVIPLRLVAQPAVEDPLLKAGVAKPDHVDRIGI